MNSANSLYAICKYGGWRVVEGVRDTLGALVYLKCMFKYNSFLEKMIIWNDYISCS